jgi:acyl-CoA synthetase (AMP-forming)/AMP-acid ligase II
VNTRLAPPELEVLLDGTEAAVDLAPETPLPDGPPYVAAFFYTSGTTSGPKAVPTTHLAFLTNAENLKRTMGITGASDTPRTLISVPRSPPSPACCRSGPARPRRAIWT